MKLVIVVIQLLLVAKYNKRSVYVNDEKIRIYYVVILRIM